MQELGDQDDAGPLQVRHRKWLCGGTGREQPADGSSVGGLGGYITADIVKLYDREVSAGRRGCARCRAGDGETRRCRASPQATGRRPSQEVIFGTGPGKPPGPYSIRCAGGLVRQVQEYPAMPSCVTTPHTFPPAELPSMETDSRRHSVHGIHWAQHPESGIRRRRPRNQDPGNCQTRRSKHQTGKAAAPASSARRRRAMRSGVSEQARTRIWETGMRVRTAPMARLMPETR